MLGNGNSILVLSVVLVTGILGGWLAKRLSAPAITGQIVIGALLGPGLLGVVTTEALHGLRPLTLFALGLIAVAVGNHLNFRLLKANWRRLALLLLLEVTLTPALVFAAVKFGGVTDGRLALLFAVMAIATAPATVVAIVSETRSRGPFSRKLIAAVALNNMACIVLFELARSVTGPERGKLGTLLLDVGGQLLGPAAVGVGVALILIVATRHVARTDLLVSSSLLAILVTTGVANQLKVSSLLACLFLGITLANVTPDRDEIGHQVFDDFEHAIFAVFFTLAGMELDFAYLAPAGILSLLFVLGRLGGKTISAWLAMRLTGAPPEFGKYLGLALVPQAGVAIGLVLAVQEDPSLKSVSQMFLAVGVTAVTMNEIVGPLTTRFALRRSGDAKSSGPDWIDFLQPQHIDTELGEITLEAAVDRLAVRLHNECEYPGDVEELREDALEGLHEASYVGHGLSVPHLALESGSKILGVMGISREGLKCRTADGEPIHCVVLLGIPESFRERSLEIMTAFAKAVGYERGVEHALYQARHPQEAYDVLHPSPEENLIIVMRKLTADMDEDPRSSRRNRAT